VEFTGNAFTAEGTEGAEKISTELIQGQEVQTDLSSLGGRPQSVLDGWQSGWEDELERAELSKRTT
jgi:hypothetical protein